MTVLFIYSKVMVHFFLGPAHENDSVNNVHWDIYIVQTLAHLYTCHKIASEENGWFSTRNAASRSRSACRHHESLDNLGTNVAHNTEKCDICTHTCLGIHTHTHMLRHTHTHTHA